MKYAVLVVDWHLIRNNVSVCSEIIIIMGFSSAVYTQTHTHTHTRARAHKVIVKLDLNQFYNRN